MMRKVVEMKMKGFKPLNKLWNKANHCSKANKLANLENAHDDGG